MYTVYKVELFLVSPLKKTVLWTIVIFFYIQIVLSGKSNCDFFILQHIFPKTLLIAMHIVLWL